MAVVELRKCLITLVALYVFAVLFALVASVPMIMHVYPQSECLLFSSENNSKLYYGHWASCNIVGYVFLFVAAGAVYLIARAWMELRRMKGHHPEGPYVEEKIPSHILTVHVAVSCLALLLTVVTTAGYVSACNNLHSGVRNQVRNKLNIDPYNTRGEEIKTKFEDDYKFHRYTNRYGNAFGSEFYTIRITCRSILTDPEIHQKLHDSHNELHSRYYGYWYGQDLFAYDSQYEASKTNSMVEATLAGSWLCVIFWLGGLVLIVVQKYVIRQQKIEQDRISVHSAMMGSMAYPANGSQMGTMPYDGSVMSGSMRGSMRGSSFQRGGSMRGSDRSMTMGGRSAAKRDIDDLALSNILPGGTINRSMPSTPRMAHNANQFLPSHNNGHSLQMQQQQPQLSLASSRETGYISDNQSGFHNNQPFLQHAPRPGGGYRSDDHETEIF